MSWNYDHITVFLQNGQTLRFHKVTKYGGTFANAGFGQGELATFEYESASDGKRNVATLYFDKIVMIAGANPEQV